MATKKYVSDIKTINWNNQLVYDKLSDLSFLNRIFGPEAMERIKNQMGDKSPEMKIENFIADRDNCSFTMSPIGAIAFKITEREEPKTIKIQTDESTQFQFKLWVQLLPINNAQCKMRVTLHIELNMMMKMMIGKKLDKGINQIADSIAQLPFGMI